MIFKIPYSENRAVLRKVGPFYYYYDLQKIIFGVWNFRTPNFRSTKFELRNFRGASFLLRGRPARERIGPAFSKAQHARGFQGGIPPEVSRTMFFFIFLNHFLPLPVPNYHSTTTNFNQSNFTFRENLFSQYPISLL